MGAEKSAQRLAAKEGQPDKVAAEYRVFAVQIAALIKRVQAELVGLEVKDVKRQRKAPAAETEGVAGEGVGVGGA